MINTIKRIVSVMFVKTDIFQMVTVVAQSVRLEIVCCIQRELVLVLLVSPDTKE